MAADLKIEKGEFICSESGFRNWVTKDGSAGPSGEGRFSAESGRYHLYVSHACPWTHRLGASISIGQLQLKTLSVMSCYLVFTDRLHKMPCPA